MFRYRMGGPGIELTTSQGISSKYRNHHSTYKPAPKSLWAVVVAQLVERSLPISEVCGSNPVIGKNLYTYFEHLFTVNCELKRRK